MTPEKVEQFKAWLHEQGAEVLDPTNPYELVRFRNTNGVGIVYTGKKGITFHGEAAIGYSKFKKGERWKLVIRKRQILHDHKRDLANRDGERCFAHGNPMDLRALTIEHLLSFMHGGPDNNNNLVLVCREANLLLANKPLATKIEMIIAMRAKAEGKRKRRLWFNKVMNKLRGKHANS